MAIFLPQPATRHPTPPSLYLHAAFALESQAWILSTFLDVHLLPLVITMSIIIFASSPAIRSICADQAKHWLKPCSLHSATAFMAAMMGIKRARLVNTWSCLTLMSLRGYRSFSDTLSPVPRVFFHTGMQIMMKSS